MIISLGAVFGREITETTAKSIIDGAMSAIDGRTFVGLVPGLGNLINATTAAGITERLG